jgi:chromosomal replication initiator protein
MQAWYEFLQTLEEKLSKTAVDKWIRPLKIIRFDACNLYLEPHDPFQIGWLEEHLLPIAKKSFVNANGHPIKLHISSGEKKSLPLEAISNVDLAPAFQPLTFESDPILPFCTFEQFVASEKNKRPFVSFARLLGWNALTNKEEEARESCNPIYLYGPAGSGKTHLLMAAAHFLRSKKKKVLYVKGETFTAHVVNAIRAGVMTEFRRAYRGIDVLIIDDVGIFGRKNATQEELFHTFNTLHVDGKQILLSAHIHPRLLEYIEDRLISRFEWGITLPLEKGDDPVVLAEVLKSRSNFYNLPLKKNLQEYLLKHFTSKTTLCRALHVLKTSKEEKSSVMELSSLEPLLKKLFEDNAKAALTPEKILDFVSTTFGIRSEDLLSKSKLRESVLPRQIAMYVLREELHLPFMKIGDIFHRDHSTVMSSIKLITQGIASQDPDVTYHMNQLRTLFSKL